jgi:exodeoxyribonuclease VIII
MIDLETMGVGSNPAVIAIGAVFFDNEEVSGPFHRRIPIEDAQRYGTIDGATVRWWMEQDDDARKRVMSSKKSVSTIEALNDFVKYLTHNSGGRLDDVKVWGNGAAFDNVILSELFKRANMTPVWKFWNDRCYRTVKAMYPDVKMKHKGVKHDALHDATAQAKHLIKIAKKHNLRL